nr:hypothetical protein [Tanacetum cinerariifolium]
MLRVFLSHCGGLAHFEVLASVWGVEGILSLSAAKVNAYLIHMDADGSLHACDEDVGLCISIDGLRNGAS